MPSARDIAFVGCRLLALFVVASSLEAIVFNSWFLLQTFRSQQQWSLQDRVAEAAFYIVPIIALLVVVAILWWGADWIASKVAAGATEAPSTTKGDWSPRIILTVAVILLGLYLLIWTAPHLALFVQFLFNDGRVDPQSLISFLLQGAIGVGCILGSQRIANFIARLRRWQG